MWWEKLKSASRQFRGLRGLGRGRESEAKLTAVVQVLAHLHVPMSPRGDVEIALHLVPIDAPIHPTRIASPPHPWRLCELPPPLPRPEVIMHVLLPRILLLLLLPPILRRANPPAPTRRPRVPSRRFPRQHIPGQDAVATSVLHVDVQIPALHGDDDVEVDLQIVRDALFHAEGVRGGPSHPAAELGGGEVEAD